MIKKSWHRKLILFMALGVLTLSHAAATETQIRALASVKPVHSLLATLMEGTGEPQLLIEGLISPHDFRLRPSDAEKLSEADLIFWVDESLETALPKSLESLASKAEVIELSTLPELKTLSFREEAFFIDDSGHHHGDLPEGEEPHHDEHKHGKEAHHDDHDEHKHGKEAHHDDHDEHKHGKEAHHDDHDDHDEHKHGEEAHHDEHKHSEEAHNDDHDGHDHYTGEGSLDPHLWLDPKNALLIARHMAKVLTEHNPGSAAQYQSNLEKLETELKLLDHAVAGHLAPLKDKPYVVFHDAYQYFEKRYELASLGAVRLGTAAAPGPAHLQKLQEVVRENKVGCLFTEPSFSPKFVETLSEDAGLKVAELDPTGSRLEPGPGLYLDLILGLANSLSDCLAEDKEHLRMTPR